MQNIADQIKKIRELTNAYKLSQIIISAEKLGVFNSLKHDPKGLEQIAKELNLEVSKIGPILNALAHADLIKKIDNNYFFSDDYSILDPSNPQSQLGYLRYAGEVSKKWIQLSEAIKNNQIREINFNEITGENSEAARAFIGAMHTNAKSQALFIANNFDFTNHNILDLGAGAGTYSIEVGKKFPNSTGKLVELPNIVPITKEYVESAKMSNRFKVDIGNYKDTFGESSFDDIFLFATIHQEEPQDVLNIINNCHKSLKNNGRLFLTSFFLNDNLVSPPFPVLFAVEMLVMVSNGKAYTHSEIYNILEKAKFNGITKHDDCPGPATLYVSKK